MPEEVIRESADQRLQRARDHIRLENTHDLTAVMDTFGPTARYDDEPWDEHHQGREAVRSLGSSRGRPGSSGIAAIP